MENAEIINLWKVYDKKLEENLLLNRQNAEDITRLKVRSFLASMQPLKIFTMVVGLLWVGFVDTLIINLFFVASPFFLVSAAIQVLLTKLSIGIYLYQLVLIRRVNISGPIVATQDTLARLVSTTLWVARILFLQLPVWTTFYLTKSMFTHTNVLFYLIQGMVTLVFAVAAIWLFRNIRYENRDRKWFRLIFNGQEWNPVMRSVEMLNQVTAYRTSNQNVF